MEGDAKISVLSKSMVVPAAAARQHERHLFLPGSDSYWRWVPYNRRLLFYKATLTSDQALYASTTIATLKSSLSRVLAHFYPFAGRLLLAAQLHDGSSRLEILCDGQGVEFVEASVDAHFQDLEMDNFQIKDFFRGLTPSPTGDDEFSMPLLSVQVTRFLGGEIAMGCVHSHVLGDGSSFWNFMVSWAEHARGEKNLTIVPVHDRTLLDFRGYLRDLKEEDMENYLDVCWKTPPLHNGIINQDVKKEDLITRVFHFSGEMVINLKAWANTMSRGQRTEEEPWARVEVGSGGCGSTWGDGNGEVGACGHTCGDGNAEVGACGHTCGDGNTDANHGKDKRCVEEGNARQGGACRVEYTTYEALCAHVWRSTVVARRLEGNTKVGLVILANVRRRLEPSIPEGYVGNAVIARTVMATAAELMVEPMHETAGRIHGKIKGLTNLSIKQEMACLEGITRKRLSKWAHGFACLNVVSSPRFPIFQVDFGWGSPSCVRPISVGIHGELVFFAANRGALVLFPAKDNGIDVSLTLQHRPMQNLINDPTFLSFTHKNLCH